MTSRRSRDGLPRPSGETSAPEERHHLVHAQAAVAVAINMAHLRLELLEREPGRAIGRTVFGDPDLMVNQDRQRVRAGRAARPQGCEQQQSCGKAARAQALQQGAKEATHPEMMPLGDGVREAWR